MPNTGRLDRVILLNINLKELHSGTCRLVQKGNLFLDLDFSTIQSNEVDFSGKSNAQTITMEGITDKYIEYNLQLGLTTLYPHIHSEIKIGNTTYFVKLVLTNNGYVIATDDGTYVTETGISSDIRNAIVIPTLNSIIPKTYKVNDRTVTTNQPIPNDPGKDRAYYFDVKNSLPEASAEAEIQWKIRLIPDNDYSKSKIVTIKLASGGYISLSVTADRTTVPAQGGTVNFTINAEGKDIWNYVQYHNGTTWNKIDSSQLSITYGTNYGDRKKFNYKFAIVKNNKILRLVDITITQEEQVYSAYYGTTNLIPVTETDIYNGNRRILTGILQTIVLDKADRRCYWVAVPKDKWTVTEWRDNLGTDIFYLFDDLNNDVPFDPSLYDGTGFFNVGKFIVFMNCMLFAYNNTYTIKLQKL